MARPDRHCQTPAPQSPPSLAARCQSLRASGSLLARGCPATPRPILRRCAARATATLPRPASDNSARGSARSLAIFECHLSIHNDVAYPGAQLVRLLVDGMVLDGVWIKHDDVSEVTRLQASTIFQGKVIRR